MFTRRPLVYRRSSALPPWKDRGPAANSLEGRMLREVARTTDWCLVAPQIRRLDWAFTKNARAAMWLERHGYVEVHYQPARRCTENVWVRALPQEM